MFTAPNSYQGKAVLAVALTFVSSSHWRLRLDFETLVRANLDRRIGSARRMVKKKREGGGGGCRVKEGERERGKTKQKNIREIERPSGVRARLVCTQRMEKGGGFGVRGKKNRCGSENFTLCGGKTWGWQCKFLFCRPEISNFNLIFILFSFVLFVYMFLCF